MLGNIPKWNISLQKFIWMSGKVAVSKKLEKEKMKKKKEKQSITLPRIQKNARKYSKMEYFPAEIFGSWNIYL